MKGENLHKLGNLVEFSSHISKKTLVDEGTGELRCRECESPVVVDWFERKLECQGCDELW